MPNIKPCNNKILVERVEVQDQHGGLVIPDNVESALTYYLVHAVADEVKCCSPRDHVILMPDCNKLGLDDTKFIGLTDASNVLAVVYNINNKSVI